MIRIYMRNFKEHTFLLMLFLGEFFRGAFFLTFLPLHTTEFLGWPVTTAGLAISAHFMTETLLKLFAGWQFDRIGRPIITAGLGIGLAAFLALRLNPSPAMLIAASAILGAGFSPLGPGVMAEVAPVQIPRRAMRAGMVYAAWLGGMGSGMIAVNFVIVSGFDLAFSVMTGFLLAAFLLSGIIIMERKPVRGGRACHPGELLDSLRQMAFHPAVVRLLLPGMLLQTMSASLLLPILPVLARTNLGLDHRSYGLVLAAGGLATVLSLAPLGRMADRVRLKTILWVSFAAISAELAVLALAGSRSNALVLAVLLGTSYAALLPAWNMLLARIIPKEKQATGWGVFSTIEGLGISLGPAAGGLAARAWSPALTLLAAAAVTLFMALLYLFYPVERLLPTRR